MDMWILNENKCDFCKNPITGPTVYVDIGEGEPVKYCTLCAEIQNRKPAEDETI